jgi:hypothetical protein
MERRELATLGEHSGAMGEVVGGVCRWQCELDGEAQAALVAAGFGRELLLVAASGRWWARIERVWVEPSDGRLTARLLLRRSVEG